MKPPKNFLKTTWFWLPRSTMKGNENHNDFANVLNCTNRAFITWKLVSLPTVTHINDLPCNTRRDKFLARVIKAMVYKSTTNILHFVASKCWKQVLISNKYVWFTLKKKWFHAFWVFTCSITEVSFEDPSFACHQLYQFSNSHPRWKAVRVHDLSYKPVVN